MGVARSIPIVFFSLLLSANHSHCQVALKTKVLKMEVMPQLLKPKVSSKGLSVAFQPGLLTGRIDPQVLSPIVNSRLLSMQFIPRLLNMRIQPQLLSPAIFSRLLGENRRRRQ